MKRWHRLLPKDKAMAEIKEATGKITDNEQLELKGKAQSLKADLTKKAEDVKETVAGKVNDLIDKTKDKTDSI